MVSAMVKVTVKIASLFRTTVLPWVNTQNFEYKDDYDLLA